MTLFGNHESKHEKLDYESLGQPKLTTITYVQDEQ